MKRALIVGAGLLGVLVVAGAAGSYAYFFSGLRSAPRPLALSTTTAATPTTAASPASAATASSSGGTSGLEGRWTVAQGSQAGYRVKEVFAGQTAAHEAVARTSAVSGDLTVNAGANGLQVTALNLKAQLSGLHSVDQVAGLDVSRRDFIVTSALEVFRYPDATFAASTIDLPANLTSGGGPVSLTVPGQLTIHGVTRPVTVTVQVQVSGNQAQVAGSTSFDMTSFSVSPPQVPITVVQPQVTLEFQLNLARG
jgi:polyisoprenoid-binding protein YceI